MTNKDTNPTNPHNTRAPEPPTTTEAGAVVYRVELYYCPRCNEPMPTAYDDFLGIHYICDRCKRLFQIHEYDNSEEAEHKKT